MATSNATIALLGEIANDVKSMADYRIFPVSSESMLFSLYTVLMISHCLSYWKSTRHWVWGIFAVYVCLYTLCAVAWTLDVCIMSLELYHLLPSRLTPDSSGVPINQALEQLNGNLALARLVCEELIFVFCDSISLWRAYVIYGRPRWLKIVCLLVFSLAGVLYVLDAILSFPSYLASPPGYALRLSQVDNGAIFQILGSVALSTTAFSQVFATILITRIALLHRKAVQRLLPRGKSSTDLQRSVSVLYIVIESGILYALLWICYVLSNFGVFGQRAAYWSDHWICPISGIYPTLIAVVVSLRTSLLEKGVINAPGFGSVSMHFATVDDGTPRSDTTMESHSNALGESVAVFKNQQAADPDSGSIV